MTSRYGTRLKNDIGAKSPKVGNPKAGRNGSSIRTSRSPSPKGPRIATRYSRPGINTTRNGTTKRSGKRLSRTPTTGVVGTSSRTATPGLRTAGGRTVISPSRRSTTTPRRISRSRSGAYGYGSYAGSTRYSYGSAHWSNHWGSVCYSSGWGWGNSYASSWGCYAFPFYYGCRYPYSYYNSGYGGYSYGSYGYGGYGYAGYGCWPNYWWWPSTCYIGGSWLGFGYYDYGYKNVYYPPSTSTIVVREVVEGSTPSEAPVEEEGGINALAKKHLDLGDFYFKEGRFEKASESYMRALAYAPDDGSLHFVIADSLFAQGDYHYAAFMIQKGLEYDPALARADADKRTFYGDPKLFDSQMDKLRKYLSEKPYDAAAHLVFVYNLKFSGKPDAARLANQKLFEIDPTNESAKLFKAALEPAKTPAVVTPTEVKTPAPIDPKKKAVSVPIKK